MAYNFTNKINLEEREDFFKTLIQMSPDAILVHSKGRFLFSNSAGLDLLHAKSFEELAKVPVINIVHPDFKEIVIERLDDLEKKRIPIPPLIEKIIALDGSIVDVEIYGRPIRYQELDANLLIFRDITKQLADQTKLRESEIQKITLFKALPDLVFLINKEGIILDFNIPEDVTLYMPRPEKPGLKITNILPNHIWDDYISRIQHTLRTKETLFLEYEYNVSGKNQVFEVRFIYYEKNKILTITRNITNKKAIEEEQRRILNIESIGLLAGGIAHDFNNILTKIIGNINLAKLEQNIPQNTLKFFEEIENATGQAKKLTNQLLTFSKGGEPLIKVESIKEIIEESLSFFLSGSKSKVTRSYSDDNITVDVEAGQIEQVISNLIINADQAMPNGGLINISVDVQEIRKDKYPRLIEGKYVRIAISDEGEGITDEIKTKIFEPYFTTKKSGTGLGLTTCYSIVKRHHGYMNVENNFPKGSTFTVYLPYREHPIVNENTDLINEKNFTGKVLIMDDSVEIQNLLGKMLERLGFTFDTANDGKEAILKYEKAMNSDPFTLLIMDLTIPGGLGGKESLQEIKKLYPQVKAIVSSGYSNDPVIAKYRKFGFLGVLPKPYSLDELKKVIAQVL